MATLDDIEIGKARPAEFARAAGVASRALFDNPGSVVAYGDSPKPRMNALQSVNEWIITSSPREPLVARRGDVVVAVAMVSPPETCLVRRAAKAEMRLGIGPIGIRFSRIPWGVLLAVLRLGRAAQSRLAQWTNLISQHDPKEPHQHVELVAVEPALQGMGVGRQLMEALREELDRSPAIAHLETDTADNVRFYERWGFRVVAQEAALGIDNWFMQRSHGGK